MPVKDFKERTNQIIQYIQENKKIHPENSQKLAEFKRDRSLNGISSGTLQKDISHLKMLF